MAYIRHAVYLVFLAVLSPWLYDRYICLSQMLANRPGKLRPINNFKSLEISCADSMRNCEDVILEEDLGVAILSCDPGRDRWNTVMGTFHPPSPTNPRQNTGALHIFDYAHTRTSRAIHIIDNPATSAQSITQDFHPLGIAYDPSTSTLYAINHARSGPSIEIFHLAIPSARATHLRTITHPLLPAPNALALLGNGKMYVTNDHAVPARRSRLVSQLETLSGAPGGSVVYLDTHRPARSKRVARVPFANGIVRVNESVLAVASSSTQGIYFFGGRENGVDLEFRFFVRGPAAPDNLSVDGKGRLLVAGHPFAPGLMGVAARRPACDERGGGEERGKCGCEAASWVGEWSEEEGLRTLLVDGGGEGRVCSSSTAVRDVRRGVGLVSMLYGKGVGVWRE